MKTRVVLRTTKESSVTGHWEGELHKVVVGEVLRWNYQPWRVDAAWTDLYGSGGSIQTVWAVSERGKT